MTIDQDKDVLAAEYVLGTLGADERTEAQGLIATDASFAEIVRGWERRLGELSAMVDPVDPPSDMWDRIKAGVAVSRASAQAKAADAVKSSSPASAPTQALGTAVAASPDATATPAATAGPAATATAAEAPTAAEAEAPTRAEAPTIAPAEAPIAAAAETATAAPAEAPTAAAAEPPTAGEASSPTRTEAPASAAGQAPTLTRASALTAGAAKLAGAEPAADLQGSVPRVLAAPLPPQPDQDTAPVQLAERVARWRAATMLTTALAACLLAVVVIWETIPDQLPALLQPRTAEFVGTAEVRLPRPAAFVAVLQRNAALPAFLLTFDLDKRMLAVRTVGAERPAGKSYELWLVSDKYPTPRSLGLIGAAPYTVQQPDPEYDAVVINRATYEVSLEPEGGSPTGTPTGPVLYSGKLLQATPPDFPARVP